MSDRPSTLRLQHILIAVRDVATEWHDLGLQLGLPESILKLIGSSPDIEGHLRMMVSKWLDYDPEASWDNLANALNIMGKNTIAANIRSKYVGAVATALNVVDTTDSKTRQEITLQIIKSRFASLQLEVRMAMEARNVKVSDAHQYLVASFQGYSIPEAPDLTKLFNFVTEANLWRYDHYVPLQQLAQQFLYYDEEVREHILDYQDQLSHFVTNDFQTSSKSAEEMVRELENSVALYENNIHQKIQKSDEEREQLMKQLQSKAEEVTKLNEQLKLYEQAAAEVENKTKKLTSKDLPLLMRQLKVHAAKWREIGIQLGFLTSELATIEARPNLSQSAPLSWLVAMLEEWLQWAPGDRRGSTSFATLEDLTDALNEAGLGASACDLKL